MNKFVSLSLLLILLNGQSWASGENTLVYTEKIALELVDYRDLDQKIHFELVAPIELGKIHSLTLNSEKGSVTLDGKEFQKLGLPVMSSLRITNSSRDKDLIYVKMRFVENSIPNPIFKNGKCHLNLVFKNFKYQYQRVSVEHDGVIRSLYYVPNCSEPHEIAYNRLSDLTDTQKRVIESVRQRGGGRN